MDSSFQVRGHEFRSDSFSDSDRAGDKRNEEIVKRGSCARATTHFDSVYEKNRKSSPEAVQKQCCMQQHWERQKRQGSRAS